MRGKNLVRAGGAGVVLVAAGEGTRMGLGSHSPKALVDLDGLPMAAHSLSLFEENTAIGGVVIVAPPGLIPTFRKELAVALGFEKVSAIVDGGPTRQDSVRLGLEALDANLNPVLIHDAARPLLTMKLLNELIEKGKAVGACIPGVPLAGTVKRMGPGGLVSETLDRSTLREAQTPQVFEASLIREAHRLAREEGIEATDDAALVERMGAAVAVVDGDPENIKVTRPVDLDLARVVLGKRE